MQKKCKTNYIGLPLVRTFAKDARGTQPRHLSIFERAKGFGCWYDSRGVVQGRRLSCVAG